MRGRRTRPPRRRCRPAPRRPCRRRARAARRANLSGPKPTGQLQGGTIRCLPGTPRARTSRVVEGESGADAEAAQTGRIERAEAVVVTRNRPRNARRVRERSRADARQSWNRRRALERLPGGRDACARNTARATVRAARSRRVEAQRGTPARLARPRRKARINLRQTANRGPRDSRRGRASRTASTSRSSRTRTAPRGPRGVRQHLVGLEPICKAPSRDRDRGPRRAAPAEKSGPSRATPVAVVHVEDALGTRRACSRAARRRLLRTVERARARPATTWVEISESPRRMRAGAGGFARREVHLGLGARRPAARNSVGEVAPRRAFDLGRRSECPRNERGGEARVCGVGGARGRPLRSLPYLSRRPPRECPPARAPCATKRFKQLHIVISPSRNARRGSVGSVCFQSARGIHCVCYINIPSVSIRFDRSCGLPK